MLKGFMEEVWHVRSKHLVPSLPHQYVYFLKCCMNQDCIHPLYQQGLQLPQWFTGDPSVDYFPLPVPDVTCKWGNTDCSRCQGKICYGHFLAPESVIHSNTAPLAKPPSVIIKEAFEQLLRERKLQTVSGKS